MISDMDQCFIFIYLKSSTKIYLLITTYIIRLYLHSRKVTVLFLHYLSQYNLLNID